MVRSHGVRSRHYTFCGKNRALIHNLLDILLVQVGMTAVSIQIPTHYTFLTGCLTLFLPPLVQCLEQRQCISVCSLLVAGSEQHRHDLGQQRYNDEGWGPASRVPLDYYSLWPRFVSHSTRFIRIYPYFTYSPIICVDMERGHSYL